MMHRTAFAPSAARAWITSALPKTLCSILAMCAWPFATHALPSFDLGISTQYVVIPGSTVHVNAILRNTGDEVLHFDGHRDWISASLSRGAQDDDWDAVDSWIWSDLHGQFAGLTLRPFETFDFLLGSFDAPVMSHGKHSRSEIAFTFRYEDIFAGTWLPDAELPAFDEPVTLNITLGRVFDVTDSSFNSLCVVDQSSRTILSGPASCRYDVPEVPTLPIAALGLLMLGALGLQRTSRKMRAED